MSNDWYDLFTSGVRFAPATQFAPAVQIEPDARFARLWLYGCIGDVAQQQGGAHDVRLSVRPIDVALCT